MLVSSGGGGVSSAGGSADGDNIETDYLIPLRLLIEEVTNGAMGFFPRHLGVVVLLPVKVPRLDLPESRQVLGPRLAQLDLPARKRVGGNVKLA